MCDSLAKTNSIDVNFLLGRLAQRAAIPFPLLVYETYRDGTPKYDAVIANHRESSRIIARRNAEAPAWHFTISMNHQVGISMLDLGLVYETKYTVQKSHRSRRPPADGKLSELAKGGQSSASCGIRLSAAVSATMLDRCA